MRTDEGVTGWGEITTTMRPANRAIAAAVRTLNDLLIGEYPSQIERIWHKTFRFFTYVGTRGATSQVVSGVDIALRDIRGKVRDETLTPHSSRPEPVHEQGGCRGGDPRHSRFRAYGIEIRSVPA